jgi:hypothetical protein
MNLVGITEREDEQLPLDGYTVADAYELLLDSESFFFLLFYLMP